MSMTPSAEQICDEFCRILNAWLDPSEIDEINRRNTLSEYKDACASHDFCDPNQAMADALQAFGIEFSLERSELINAAWDLAKERNFCVSRKDADTK